MRLDDDRVRAEAERFGHRHRRADAEGAHLVRRGRDDAAPRLPADDEGLAAERRIVPLLDRRVERVHVDVQDLAHERTLPPGRLMLSRAMRRSFALLAIAAIAVVALWRPAAEHVRAASLLARFGDATQGASPLVSEELFPIPRLNDPPIRARLYLPRGAPRGAIVLVPGVHHLGIDEPRLVRFARAVCASGVAVLTPEIGALIDYRIEGASADEIGEAAHALHRARRQRRSASWE